MSEIRGTQRLFSVNYLFGAANQYCREVSIVGFHMTSIKFRLKTVDPTEILLSRCIRAAEK